MIVSVGELSARCKSCDGKEFRLVDDGALRLASRMACTQCGEMTTYRELLESIGEEAMRRANEALENLRKGRRPPKPRK